MPPAGIIDYFLWAIACFALNALLALLVHGVLVHWDLLDYRASGGTAAWWQFRQERQRCKKEFRHQMALHEQGLAPAPPVPSLGAYVRYLEDKGPDRT